MMYLVELCKTVPGKIFDTSNSWLKWRWKILNFQFFFLKYHYILDKIFQFWCANGSDSEKDKEELIKVESNLINVSEINGDEYILGVYSIMIEAKE